MSEAAPQGVHTVSTPDGRELEVLTGGDPDGLPWLYHGGSPSAVAPFGVIDRAARDRELRLITWSRPGYGASTPRPRPAGVSPRMADDVEDAVSILDALGVEEFVTLGWSGGGPRALACAALLPGRCLAATTLAGVAPHEADDLDWFAGMAPENLEEYTAAEKGAEFYGQVLTVGMEPMAEVTAEQLAADMGGLMTPVDVAATTGETAEWLALTFRRALAQGVVGVRDDGLAAVAPWGFDVHDITVPVAVWQGGQDAMVPAAHGDWLGAHVPGARLHRLPDEGHVSLLASLPEILADLRALAGR